MFDLNALHYGFVVLATLSILSGVRIILDHVLPQGNAFSSVVGKIVDFLSANVKH